MTDTAMPVFKTKSDHGKSMFNPLRHPVGDGDPTAGSNMLSTPDISYYMGCWEDMLSRSRSDSHF